MLESVKEALGVVFGNAAGVAIALCGLAGIAVGAAIDPAAAGVVAAALMVALVATYAFALRQRTLFTGPYRVLDETIVWEMASADGSKAFHEKRQLVRFNYLVIAHIDLASGDGDVFASYRCNYGAVLKRFRRADEEGVLIELDPERTRNEQAELISRREIRDGFVGPNQWIAHRASVASGRTELIVRFPPGRSVTNVRIGGPTGHGSRPAKDNELRTEGARRVLRLKPRRYKANQTVTITWSW